MYPLKRQVRQLHTSHRILAGHSHFRNIMHRKAAQDSKKMAAFTKVAAQITTAVRVGGGPDPASNPRLATALQRAKRVNFPKDRIEDAIQKAMSRNYSGEVLTYEVYGPEGSAIMIETLTDNRNRTAQVLRQAIKEKGSMATPGSVKHLFKRKGLISFNIGNLTEDAAMELGLEAGAEDVQVNGKVVEMLLDPENVTNATNLLQEKGLTNINVDIEDIPDITVTLTESAKQTFDELIKALDAIDEVTNITHNVAVQEEAE